MVPYSATTKSGICALKERTYSSHSSSEGHNPQPTLNGSTKRFLAAGHRHRS